MALPQFGDTGVEVADRYSADLVVKALRPASTPLPLVLLMQNPFHLRTWGYDDLFPRHRLNVIYECIAHVPYGLSVNLKDGSVASR